MLNVLKPCAGHSNGCSPLARRGVGMGPVELQTGLEKALAVTFLYKNIHNIFFLNQTGTHNKFCVDCLPCLES